MSSKKVFLPDDFTTSDGRPKGGSFLPEWAREGEGAAPERGFMPAGRFVPEWAGEAPHRSGRADRGALADRGAKPLVVKGGHCVVPYTGILTQDILIEGGKIKAMGADIPTEGRDVLRADMKFVLPGIVDPHVHLGLFAPFAEEIASESISALANGVTTIGLYLGAQGSYLRLLDETIALIEARSHVDVFLHLVLYDETQLKELPLYAAKYGVRSFKIYMAGIPGMIPSSDEGFILDAMEAVAGLGPGAVLNIHAENYRILEWAAHRSRNEAPEGDLRSWERSHPAFAEKEAMQRALALAEGSGVKVYFVHVSSSESIQFARKSRAESPGKFWIETTSPYLSTNFDSAQRELLLMSPPVRSEQDRLALWKGIADDTVDTIGTDHTPLTVEQKTKGRKFWDTVPGYPALGTHLPLLLDGIRRNGVSLQKLAEKASANPSKIFGVYPRKGSIMPGSDADLVIVDTERTKTISPATARSRSDFALRQGERSIGWPLAVVKGGAVLYPDDPEIDFAVFAGSDYIRRYI